jgi:hypothetical protein
MSDESLGLDIMGSDANNTTIMSSGAKSIEVDIIGSTASNIQIGYPEEVVSKPSCRDCMDCEPCGGKKIYKTPWDDFRRPLCYPWSSYIPTRYNRPFINTHHGYSANVSPAIALGRGMAFS